MKPSIELSQTLKQKMALQTVKGLQLLSLPYLSLEAFLGKVILDNPFLELDYGEIETPGLDDLIIRQTDLDEYPWSGVDSYEADASISAEEKLMGSDHESETLQASLQLQLFSFHLLPWEKNVGLEIIKNIDDNGYFTGDFPAIAGYCGVDISLVKQMMSLIQTFQPKGVGAVNLAECLFLQVDKKQADYSLIRQILLNDLEDLGSRKFDILSHKYNLSKLHLQRIFDYICTLNPWPGNIFPSASITPYIIPDIIVSQTDNQMDIQVRGVSEKMLHMNQDYFVLTKNSCNDLETKDYIKEKHLEALNLMKSLDMRHQTLKKLAAFLVAVQKDFFQLGPNHLKPLTMRQAAEWIKMHPSTISRCVKDKYIETHWGVFPLKYFFSVALPEDGSCTVSATIVKSAIKKLIADENSTNPYSDQNIADYLNRLNISISRRTVAKYRMEAGINCQSKRKRYA